MGGINHQPCGKYLILSTSVSKLLSLLQVSFWQSNVEFENAILTDLRNRESSMQSALNQITKAIHLTNDTDDMLQRLIERLNELNFYNTPQNLDSMLR